MSGGPKYNWRRTLDLTEEQARWNGDLQSRPLVEENLRRSTVDYRAWSVLGDEIGIKVLHAELGGERSRRQDDCGVRIRSRYHNVSAKMVNNILRATKKHR